MANNINSSLEKSRDFKQQRSFISHRIRMKETQLDATTATAQREGLPLEHQGGGYERASTLTNPYGLPGPLGTKQLLCACTLLTSCSLSTRESRWSDSNSLIVAVRRREIEYSADTLRRSMATARHSRRFPRWWHQLWNRNRNVPSSRFSHDVDSRREHGRWSV